MLSPIAIADDLPNLPSRKASVVIPLLKQVTGKDRYGDIKKILGVEDFGFVSAGFAQLRYTLDDKTVIQVTMWAMVDLHGGIAGIGAYAPGKPYEVLFRQNL